MENIHQEQSITRGPTSQKLILVTYRLSDNSQFIPAEEMIVDYIFNDVPTIVLEKIILEEHYKSNFLGSLPCFYFTGKIIPNDKLLFFLKDVLFEENKEFDVYFDNLVYTIKESFRFGNQHYYYWKSKEKKEKKSNFFMRFLGRLLNINQNVHYESLSNEILNNLIEFFTPHKEINIHEIKSNEVILDSITKLSILKQKQFDDNNRNLFIRLIFMSFLSEDKFLFNKLKRPFVENLKYQNNPSYLDLFQNYLEKEQLFTKPLPGSFNVKLNTSINDTSRLHDKIKKHAMFFDPKKKRNFRTIEEIQINKSFQNDLIGVGIFCGMTLLLLILSSRKK